MQSTGFEDINTIGKSNMHQHGLFDVQIRHEKIKQYATMLDQLNSLINCEEFRLTLETIHQK